MKKQMKSKIKSKINLIKAEKATDNENLDFLITLCECVFIKVISHGKTQLAIKACSKARNFFFCFSAIK